MKNIFIIFDTIRRKYLRVYETFEEAVEFLTANNRDNTKNRVVILKRRVKLSN